MKVILEKHNNRVNGGSWFRTRRGELIGRGLPSRIIKGEECEVSPAKWADPKFRKDVYDAMRIAGYQVVARFETNGETPSSPTPQGPSEREKELEATIANLRVENESLRQQLETPIVLAPVRNKGGRPRKTPVPEAP